MSKPLTRDELISHTGYKQPSKQLEWFRRELGIDPPKGRDGYPTITQEVIDAATLAKRTNRLLQGSVTTIKPAETAAQGPRWKVPA